jgi:hypothetical protein
MRRRFLALSFLLLPLPACNDAIPNDPTPNNLLPTVALADRVAYVEQSSHTAFILDPAGKPLVPRMVSVGKAPVAAVKRNGLNQLLVLSQGDPGSAQKTPVAAQLEVIDADASVIPVTYTLDSQFDGLAQSADGRFVLLYHGASTQISNNTALFNPNELAIVDLTLPPSAATASTLANPYAKSIRSLGGVPTGVVFSPNFTFASKARSLAVILAQNYVTIVDLGNPDRTEITVPLSTDSSTFSPEQVLFDAVHSNIYVRADGSNDIFQIALTDLGAAAPAPPNNDFRASLSMLAAGTNPSDMALYGTGDATRLAVVAPGSQTFVIINPTTSSTTSVPTAIQVNRMVVFDAGSPSAPNQSAEQALLVDVNANGGSTSVLFADLQSIESAGSLALLSYPIGGSVASVVPMVDQGIVVVTYPQYSSNALAVLDLARRTLSPIAGSPLGGVAIDFSAPSRLWSIDSQQQNGLCYLNLVARAGQASLSTGTTWLDQNIVGIIPLGQASSD